MKRNWTYSTIIALIGCTMFASCSFTSSSNYMGTMAGAEIGGVIGEALGWMSTSRNEGPGKAMLGSVVGTVVGAAVGNAVTKDKAVTSGRRNNTREERQDNVVYSPDYQISGGNMAYGTDNRRGNNDQRYSNERNTNMNSYRFLRLRNASYQDEDGNGKCSRNETLNIFYEITNTSNHVAEDVVLKIESLDGDKYFAVSPANTISIAAGETVRYKAKAFCKKIPSGSTATFNLTASSKYAGNTTTILQIKVGK